MIDVQLKLMTTNEAATRARVTDATVRCWIKDGRLEATKLETGQYRIEERALASVLQPQKAGAK